MKKQILRCKWFSKCPQPTQALARLSLKRRRIHISVSNDWCYGMDRYFVLIRVHISFCQVFSFLIATVITTIPGENNISVNVEEKQKLLLYILTISSDVISHFYGDVHREQHSTLHCMFVLCDFWFLVYFF